MRRSSISAGGPRVRIYLPPAESLQTIGSTAAELIGGHKKPGRGARFDPSVATRVIAQLGSPPGRHLALCWSSPVLRAERRSGRTGMVCDRISLRRRFDEMKTRERTERPPKVA